jgi:hypothetical protein
LKRHSFAVDYRADINWFHKFSEVNNTTQRAGGVFNLDLPGGLTGRISDYYSDALIPRKGKEISGLSGSADPFRELPYTANDFNAQVKYRFVDRWAVEGRYNNYMYSYKNNYDNSGDYDRGTFGGSLYYRFTAKTNALIDYNYALTSYNHASINDNKAQAAFIGLSFDPSSKIKGYLKLGWGSKDYDNNQAGRNNSFSTFASLVDLTYNATQYDRLNLRANRTIDEDTDTNAPYTNTDISLGYRHVMSWNEKLSLLANIGFGTKKFEAETLDVDLTYKTRDDKIWTTGVGIGYALQSWLNFGLNYSYTNDDSNFINYNYIENKVWISAVASF